jgi:hypothetical protein
MERYIFQRYLSSGARIAVLSGRARIFHELPSRDHEDGRATWQPQGVGSEAYLLNGTSQELTPEDARKDGHIRGRSRGFMKYSGYSSALHSIFVMVLATD